MPQLPLSTLWEMAYSHTLQQAQIERDRPLDEGDWRMAWAMGHLPPTDERVKRQKWATINPNTPYPGDPVEVQK